MNQKPLQRVLGKKFFVKQITVIPPRSDGTEFDDMGFVTRLRFEPSYLIESGCPTLKIMGVYFDENKKARSDTVTMRGLYTWRAATKRRKGYFCFRTVHGIVLINRVPEKMVQVIR
jgi:hypothetical protein